MLKTASIALTIVLCALVSQGQTAKPCQPPALQTSSGPNIFSEQQEVDLGDAIGDRGVPEMEITRTPDAPVEG